MATLTSRSLPENLRPLLETIASHAQENGLGLYLVGGFVRDLLLGLPNADLDLVVEGDAIAFVQLLQEQYGGEIDAHRPFGTATWRSGSIFPTAITFIDFATARTETYEHPGALPTVQPSIIDLDLKRRDFTINTLALRLAPAPLGDLIDLYDGKSDLQKGIIRVLHNQSFIDDPTRMFRAVRFSERFAFEIEPHTHDLLAAALPYIDNVSGERLYHEFELIMREAEPQLMLATLDALGILETINLKVDQWQVLAISAAHGARARDLWGDLQIDLETVYWIILTCEIEDLAPLIDRLKLTRTLADQLVKGRRAYLTMPQLDYLDMPSTIAHQLDGLSDNALFAAWAIAGWTSPSRDLLVRYAREWKHVQPTLNGDDLIRMGLKPGPKIGTLLTRLRDAWLDGAIETPEQERAYVENWMDAEKDHDGS